MQRASLLVLVLAACGGGAPRTVITITPPPEPETRGALAGPLCQGTACTCRDETAPADGGAGAPAEGLKRFEIRIGPQDNPLWVTLDDRVLYKSAARAEECFYVDLAPGDHPMRIRASRDGGISAGVRVQEYGVDTQSWYDSFQFVCGIPGVCAHEELDDYKASLKKFRRGIQDPCGSVKVKQLSWDTGKAPDQVHPNDLAVGLTLEVYYFPPRGPHGDPACAESF